MTEAERDRLIDELLEGDISEGDFLRLEAEFTVCSEARRAYYERQKLVTALRIEAESHSTVGQERGRVSASLGRRRRRHDALTWAGVVLLLLVAGLLGWRIGVDTRNVVAPPADEPVASGFGVLVADSGARWADSEGIRGGALLPARRLTLQEGVVQVELFSGVLAFIEGPATFEALSAMALSLPSGSLRVSVPGQASGFRIVTEGGEVTFGGGEALVRSAADSVAMHAVSGAHEWRETLGGVRSLAAGESIHWDSESGTKGKETASLGVEWRERWDSFQQDVTGRRAERLQAWIQHSAKLRGDERVIAYFSMEAGGDGERRLVDDSPGENDGTVVRALRAPDRWGRPFGGLDFSPTGSRVRLTIPGRHRSLTMMCWVKIDSLDRWFNSLFLTDGHELNEPHWQIMNDGRLFFSVKRRDAKNDKHIAFSPPIWSTTQSGQWMHIATVYDGDAATTTHYVDGEIVSVDRIPEDMRIEAAEIGAASIGNWSEPKRNDPEFAVRNLNGTIDEFFIFSAALAESEVRSIYEVGRP